MIENQFANLEKRLFQQSRTVPLSQMYLDNLDNLYYNTPVTARKFGVKAMAIDLNEAIASSKQFASVVRSDIDSKALVLLFGSCAKGTTHDRSDIDIAVVSEAFGNNLPENYAKLTLIAYGINAAIEPHPFSLENWNYTTPFISEIMKTGVAL